jgi:hypothetical protein
MPLAKPRARITGSAGDAAQIARANLSIDGGWTAA